MARSQGLSRLAAALVGAAGLAVTYGLDNGMALTPPMGFSSWNAFSSNVTSAKIRNITRILIETGLAAKGYNSVHVDEGWFVSRDAQGNMVEDFVKFPEGMKGLGDWITAQETYPGSGVYMTYGLYSCRGTCQCGEWDYKGPGSAGYEAQDVNWMVNAGATFLKIDSCCGSQDHATAFEQYGLWRDAMNATGKHIGFSVCGWEEWYAPPDPSVDYGGGYTLGNQWRIAGDGDTWPALTNCFNTAARLRQYAGPGGWNDPDLLIGPNTIADGSYSTDLQARTQVNLWSVIAAPLIISNNLMEASDYNIESYGNEEVIAVDQDPLGVPGYRIVGGDLTYPCNGGGVPPGGLYNLLARTCDASNPMQKFVLHNGSTIQLQDTSGGVAVLDAYQCGTADDTSVYLYPPDNGGGTCGGKNQQWTMGNGGAIVNGNSGKCLDVWDFTGPAVDVYTCNGGPNQQFTLTAAGQLMTASGPNGPSMCLEAVPANSSGTECTNVWGRPLHDGSWAFAFVNNGHANVTVTCDENCFGFTNTTATTLAIRDLWQHAVVANLSRPFSYSTVVEAEGGSVIFRAIPTS